MTLQAFREWLEDLAGCNASLPAAEVLRRLPDVATATEGPDPLADLDVEAAGEVLDRSSSTVRDYARRGLLPGAYRQQGREWRIPRTAIRAFQRSEAEPAPPKPKPPTTTDLGAWRAERSMG